VSGQLLSIQSVTVSTQNSGPTAKVTISVYSSPQSTVSPATLLAQLQPSATSPISRPAAPTPAGHPGPPTTATVRVTR
jgi:hypothetical protein